MVKILLVGNVPPQSTTVLAALRDEDVMHITKPSDLLGSARWWQPDLIVVAGWRHLIPAYVLTIPRLGTVGFHSAKLPEYPGRAPVPWAFLRGDSLTYNTMLFLDEGVDSGDIIDQRPIAITPADTPTTLYARMADTAVEMLLQHLPALKEGTAPRTPQDLSRRGPLTTSDGWERLANRQLVPAWVDAFG